LEKAIAMFEPGMYQLGRHTEGPARPRDQYEAARGVERMSLLVWGEHCIECAAPDCFRSCDLYDRRLDGRCRRFVFGIYKNRAFQSLRGYGAEIQFKRWGKLEARGNCRMEPVRAVLAKERVIEWASQLAKRLGPIPAALTRDDRWRHLAHSIQERIVRRLHRSHRRAHVPEAFLLEVYNAEPQSCRMQLLMSLSKEPRLRAPQGANRIAPFATTFELRPGYNRHEIVTDGFRHIIDCGLPFDIALVPEADTTAHLVFLTADFVSFAKALESERLPQRPAIKCLVWDLDNTLWDGVLLENEDVALKPSVLAILKELDGRGVLHSIASKNEETHTRARLEQLGIAEYFLYPQIAWAPKSQGLRRIAERLNIGLDTIALVDDSPFELDEVQRALPEVLCLNALDMASLANNPRFAGSQSAEAKERRQLYRVAMEREEKRAEFGDDYLGFLASCEIELEIRLFDDEDGERVAELVQRTNQLNFSGMKYGRIEVAELLARRAAAKYVLRCADRYGKYGIVGFAVVSREGGEIRVEELMLSCRVQGKLIEAAFFGFLIEGHSPAPATQLIVNFRHTARNTPARQALEALGFEWVSDANAMRLELTCHTVDCRVVHVRHTVGTASVS
jgi:FkbH-like protein